MKLCSYAMTTDAGFAPNPFWDYCTLATCTPNHQRCNLEEGDWILGNGTADAGSVLIYAMEISLVLDLDSYYHDERFAQKIPSSGSWQERCGDNIYFLNARRRYVQDDAAVYHTDAGVRDQDIHGDRVFIASHFYYFGEDARPIPPEYASLIRHGRAVQYHSGDVVERFVKWIERKPKSGRLGLPRDREETAEECQPRKTRC